jgi:hypothetical protein
MKGFTLLTTMMLWIGLAVGQSLPIDFEGPALTFVDFEGGVVTTIANPQSGGINTSANVGQMVKNAGQPFAGSLLELAAPIDFSTNKEFNMKVYSPRVGATVLLKVENATDGTIFFERTATSTAANAWEILTFDYSAVSTTAQYSKLVLIFDNGTVGDGSANFTWLFDDIELINSGGPVLSQVDLPITFDDPTVNYTVSDFEGASTTLVADPTDATNTVASTLKALGAQTFAGTTTSTSNGLATRIPITATETKMNLRVYSPDAGVPVRLKLEDPNDNTKTVETEALTTVANEWEVLEFDFANEATGTAVLDPSQTFQMATVFFNFGTSGDDAGEKTYLWENLAFGPASTVGIVGAESLGLVAYPNPTHDLITLRADQRIDQVTVYNQLGQPVLTQTQTPTQVNLSGLTSGLYLLRVSTPQGAATLRVRKQ